MVTACDHPFWEVMLTSPYRCAGRRMVTSFWADTEVSLAARRHGSPPCHRKLAFVVETGSHGGIFCQVRTIALRHFLEVNRHVAFGLWIPLWPPSC